MKILWLGLEQSIGIDTHEVCIMNKNNFDMSNLPIGTYFYAITFTINGTEYNKTGRVEVVGK